MIGKVDNPSPGRLLPGLCQPDIERSTKVPGDRHMFEDKRCRLHKWQEQMRESRMNDVIRHSFNMYITLVCGHLHQVVLAHPDVATRVSAPPAERPNEIFKENLRIPVVRLEEEKLTTRLQ